MRKAVQSQARKLPNVAVVGCGYWGPNLIRNFKSLSAACSMRVVCDSSPERLEHIKSLYPTMDMTDDFDALLETMDVDVVAIATPLRTHYDLAKKSLLAGKHTFVEKPLASTSAECLELIEIAKENNLTLMVGHTFVYTSTVRFIKELIDSGELGDIYCISSSRLNLGLFQNDINVAWDLAPHDISIMHYILGMSPVSVNCQGKSHVASGLEDVTTMTLDFPNGTFATIQSSWIDPNKIRKMTIVGSKKMAVYDDIEPIEKIRIYDKRVETPPHYDTFAEFQYSYHYGDMKAPYIRQAEPLKVECRHFLDCIESGGRSDSCGEEGLRVVQILEASSESLRKGGARIEIPSVPKAISVESCAASNS